MNARLVCAWAALLSLSTSAYADAVDEGRALARQATEAFDQNKYAEAADLLRNAISLRPGNPTLMLRFASASARAGRIDDAINILNDYAAMGMLTGVEEKDFPGLANDPRLPALRARLVENAKPVGSAAVVATIDEPDALIEGVAFDGTTGRIFASSVNQRRIYAIKRGRTSIFVGAQPSGLLGAFGLAIDKTTGTLWAASSALVEATSVTPAERGRAGIFAFDLATGRSKTVALIPTDKKDHVVGDIAVASNGDVYATDGQEGKIYRLPRGARDLEEFLAGGEFHSPQGMALSESDRQLAVADYSNGVHIVDLTTKAHALLLAPPQTTLLGIDGLLRYGRDLLAIQNGIEPQRLIRIRMNKAWTAVEGVDVLAANLPLMKEPSLAAFAGDKLLVVGNAQWAHFNALGAKLNGDPLAPTNIVSVSVPKPRP